MRKLITIGIVMVFFISLAALANNPQFSMIQNQSSAVHVNLTHQATFLYTCPPFNESTAQYLSTEGTNAIILTAGQYINESSELQMIQNFTDGTPAVSAVTRPYWMSFNVTTDTWLINFSIRVDDAIPFSYRWTIFNAIWNSTYNKAEPNVNITNWGLISTSGTGDYCWSNVTTLIQLEIATTINNTFFVCINNTIDPENMINWVRVMQSVDQHDGGIVWYLNTQDSKRIYTDRDQTLKVGLMNRTLEYDSTGSYCSPILYRSDIFLYNLTTYADVPADTDLTVTAFTSSDNITWTPIPLTLNATIDTPFNGEIDIFLCYNFTSDDGTATPTLLGFVAYYEAEAPNELPYLDEIMTTFDNETLLFTIQFFAMDADEDTLNISLIWSDNTTYQTQYSIEAGSIVNFTFDCAYATIYKFYLNITDSEDAVQSSLFSFLTGEELSSVSPTITLLGSLVLLGVCLLIFVRIPNKKLT